MPFVMVIPVENVQCVTQMDPWFLVSNRIIYANSVEIELYRFRLNGFSASRIICLKQHGFSDRTVGAVIA